MLAPGTEMSILLAYPNMAGQDACEVHGGVMATYRRPTNIDVPKAALTDGSSS